MDLPAHVKEDDVLRMINALSSYRGHEWWFRTEMGDTEKSFHERKLKVISPIVLHNISNKIEEDIYGYSTMAFKNVLNTAIIYHAECKILNEKIKELEAEIQVLKSSQ